MADKKMPHIAAMPEIRARYVRDLHSYAFVLMLASQDVHVLSYYYYVCMCNACPPCACVRACVRMFVPVCVCMLRHCLSVFAHIVYYSVCV